jgi:hypothetical protein
MDASTLAIVVAILGGAFSLTGISLQVRETVRGRRQTAQTALTSTQLTVEEQRAKRTDARIEAHINRIETATAEAEQRAVAAIARAEGAERNFAELQAVNITTLARLGALEGDLARAQLVIRDLEGQIEGITA